VTRLFTVFFVLICFATPGPLLASTKEASAQNNPVEVLNKIQTLNQAITQSAQLNETAKSDLKLQLDQAQKWHNLAAQTQLETQQLKESIQNLDQRAASIKSLLQELKDQLAQVNNYDSTNVKIETATKELNQAQKTLQQGNEKYLYWDGQLNNYQRLASDGVQQQLAIEKSLSQLKAPSSAEGKTAELSLSEQVENISLISRRQLLEEKLTQLNIKIDRLERFTRYAQMERDFWAEQKSISAKLVAKLQDIVLTQKTQLAESELKQVSDIQYAQDHPLFPLQQQLIDLQQQKTDLIKKEKQIQSDINHSKELLNQSKADFARDQQIIELQSSPETVARLLHKRLESIAKIQVKDTNIVAIQNDINNAVLNQLLLSEKLRDIQTGKGLVQELLAQLSEDQQTLFKEAAMQLQMQYLHAAKDLQSLYPGFISQLSELNSFYLKQREQYIEYRQFLQNHLLWLPNAEKETLFSLDALKSNLAMLLNFNNLTALGNDFNTVISEQKPRLLFILLVIGALLYWRKKLIIKLEESANKTVSVRTDSILHSIKALLITLALALPIPLILFATYHLLSSHSSPVTITEQLATSLLNASILVLILGSMRLTCRPKGLAEKHFHWSPAALHSFYKELGWAIPFGAILTIITGINTDVLSPANQQVIGRLSFILLMFGLLVLVYRLWHPNSAIIKNAKAKGQNPAWLQLHFIWFAALLLIPAMLVWSTISGYYYSSILIAEKLNLTIGLFLASYLLRELLLRSIYISERQQHYQERLHERELHVAEQKKQQDGESSSAELPVIEEAEINYEKLNRQVKQTINLAYFFALATGLWWLWNDVLLALDLVNNSTLSLTKSEVIDGVAQQVPLTLGDLLQGLALGLITLLLAKNLPGILEFTVLKFLPITPAVRYAVSSLTQYLIAIIGFIVIFRALGIEWSNIQWLVAALSVGLGFGLQEIVANFVSGIILLFEQPIRVGDIVTVGETTGKVSKIRIRATTIVNWERQELVIPNKDIITGDLINWSLSDPVSRIKIDVGIAYGSDVNKAMQLMMEAATEHPKVLKDPEPSVIFDSFGDNALLITLRSFVDDLENRITIKSELNNLINDKMNSAGIVIAFPQRDIHLDTNSPLEIYLRKEAKEQNV